ncbi:MAG: ABC transporter permease [Chloroflexia bacterium]
MFHFPRDFSTHLYEHFYLTVLTLGIALAISLPLGFLISRYKPIQAPVLGVLGVIYTIPSLALLAFLVPFLHLGTVPAVTALVLYSLLTLVRNTAVGFGGVDPAVVEAARGMGMTSAQIFRRVELPLALPVIIAGMRITTLSIISLTTIAAWIGAGGLGQVLRDGVVNDDTNLQLLSVLAVTSIAVGADLIYRLIEWLNTAYLRVPRTSRLVAAVDEIEPVKTA